MGAPGRLEALTQRLRWQVPQNLDMEEVFFSSANVSSAEKIFPSLDIILTPDNVNQTCKNYSYNRVLGLQYTYKEGKQAQFSCPWLLPTPAS